MHRSYELFAYGKKKVKACRISFPAEPDSGGCSVPGWKPNLKFLDVHFYSDKSELLSGNLILCMLFRFALL